MRQRRSIHEMDATFFSSKQMDLLGIQANALHTNQGTERVKQKVSLNYEGTIRKGLYIKEDHQP